MNTNINYNNAPMMDLNDYNENEGMDLNMTTGEVLDMLYRTQRIIWVTEIQEYKKLVLQKEENKSTNKFEFTLKQAKEALAEKYGYSIENICIKL